MPAIQRAKEYYWALRNGDIDWGPLFRAMREQLVVFLLVTWRYAQHRLRRGGHASAAGGGVPASKRLLFISYYSPPYRSSLGTQRLTKFIKYLRRFGWNIVLITTSPRNMRETDPAGERLPEDIEIIRLPQQEARFLADSGVLVPDYLVSWIRPALRAAREAVRLHRPSAIVATVPPYSNAVAATLLAMETGIPLISDFRDPWTKVHLSWIISNKALRWCTGKLEEVTLRVSSAIAMADEKQYAAEFFVKCDANIDRKLHWIPNGYDEEDFTGSEIVAARPDRSKFIVSYVGAIYDDETLGLISGAFERWAAQFPSDLNDVEFHYAGGSSYRFDRCGFRPDYLRDHGYLPHQDAITLRCRSAAQIFCLPPSFHPHVISGKIYEMMRLPVPILAIANPSGSVARFVQRTGTGIVVDNTRPDEAADALRRMYLAWKVGESIASRDESAVGAFSRERQAQQFARIIDQAIVGNT